MWKELKRLTLTLVLSQTKVNTKINADVIVVTRVGIKNILFRKKIR